MSDPDNRNSDGTFQKGKSGNPGGRPKSIDEIVQIAREASPDAMRKIIEIMKRPDAPAPAAIAAAQHILDRAYGKPKETVDMTVKQTLEDLVLASMRKKDEAQDSVH